MRPNKWGDLEGGKTLQAMLFHDEITPAKGALQFKPLEIV